MKYFLIAGEPSGDLHGSNLMRELKKVDPASEFRFTGGDLMRTEGGTMVRHYRYMSFMGIFAVLANMGKVFRNFKICKNDILSNRPDVLFLIDYPGFNLRMAKWAKKQGIRTFMFVSPTVWAWKENRVKTIKKCIERLFVILPFEVDFYKKHDYEVYYTSIPIFEIIEKFKEQNDVSEFRRQHNLNKKPIIALLAGSRKQEINHCLLTMLSLVKQYPEYQFVVAGATSLDESVYLPYLKNEKDVSIVFTQTYQLLLNSHAAIVTSGTATLETALLEIPQIVIYKTELATFLIGRLLVKLKYFSLVNLVLNKMAVKELLQFNLKKKLAQEARKLFKDESYRRAIFSDYSIMRGQLKRGVYKQTAELTYKFLTTEKK